MCLFETYCFNDDEIEDDEDDDEYDADNEVNNPNNPIWQDSDVHTTWRGTDTTIPDPNEVNQD